MATLAQVSQAMQTVLTTVAAAAARTTGFVQRVSKCTGALFTQTRVLGFLSNPPATREELAQTAATLGLTISQPGLDQRMTDPAADCLREVLDEAAATVLAADPVAIPLLARFNGVSIQESTLIDVPGTLAPIWRGSGNQHTSPDASARLKLSVRLNLTTGALAGPHTDHGLTSDHTIPLQDAPIPAGALRIADLGFFELDVLQTIGQADGFWLPRPHVTRVMTDQDGQRRDLPTFLAAQDMATVDVPIRLGARARLSCRLLAVRVPQEVADQRRRRVRAEAKRRGRTPNATQLVLADWTIVVTNVPPEQLSVREALVLGRARWQIELLFTLWKSHGQIDEWRSEKPSAILCELYAKVIALILQHWIMLVGCWAYANRSLTKAAATVRKHALCLATTLRCGGQLAAAITPIADGLAVGCRINKSQKTPHT
ncbi:MAG: IS4 family transposase [Chloroflexota bacterium]|nr:IS4 family transposase [Chloroflexota bacterium]